MLSTVRDPQLFGLLINILLVMVVGVIGWLIKRAITGNDSKIDQAIKKIDASSEALNKLQLLIVGDYYPRKEHAEFAHHIEGVMEQMRNNIHNLRDSTQTLSGKLSVLEVTVNTMKEQAEALLAASRRKE